jgi:hypothetical protein
MISELFGILSKISAICTDSNDSWNSLTFKGVLSDNNHKEIFRELSSITESQSISKTINYQIDTTSFSSLDNFLEDLLVGSNWKISINKLSNIQETSFNFFLDKKEFKNWSVKLNPFSTENPFNKYNNLKIIVKDFNNKIIGQNFTICNETEDKLDKKVNVSLPNYENIKKNIHILAKEKFILSPQNFFILEGECDDDSIAFFKMSSETLAASLSSEIIDENNLVLRGIRKIELKISENKTKLNLKFLDELKNTVEWIYEDRTDLRLKLFLDRVTLDVDYNNDYVHELNKINNVSLLQAKERYSFAIFERKDQYHKELRELLKDLKTISDLYSSKARLVLSNLLRDVLAGFLLIGITLLSKIENLNTVINNPTIKYIFQAFSIYFIISIIYQSVFDLIDIKKTTKEFSYWKRTSREYISEKEFKTHLKETIDKREIFTYLFYSLLIITYLSISYFCWNFTVFLKQLLLIDK